MTKYILGTYNYNGLKGAVHIVASEHRASWGQTHHFTTQTHAHKSLVVRNIEGGGHWVVHARVHELKNLNA